MATKYKGHIVTMTNEDWELLGTIAKASGYSRSAYVRMLIHLKRPAPQPDEDWKSCYRELAAIGNNINQIAKMGHVTGEIDGESLKECYNAIIEMRARMLISIQPEEIV